MTIAVCVNFGDRVYLATDSLMSTRTPDGTFVPQTSNYRLKLYHLPRVNGMVAFAGRMDSARQAIWRIIQHTSRSETVTEQSVFEAIPSLLADFANNPRDRNLNFQLIFAALTQNSKAYSQELWPGLGVPPKTFSGVFSVDYEHRQIESLFGQAVHVPSDPSVRFWTPEPQYRLMDGFLVGSGASRIGRESEFFFLKYERPQFVMSVLAPMLHAHFHRLPIEVTGVGGAFQVGFISEQGAEGQVAVVGSTPEGISPRTATVHQVAERAHISYIVEYQDPPEIQVIRSIFDERPPYEIREIDLFG